MSNLIIFGLESPKLDFKQSPESQLIISCQNNYSVTHSKGRPIHWAKIIISTMDKRVQRLSGGSSFIDNVAWLDDLNTYASEKTFFRKYIEECDTWSSHQEKMALPALIPQVWVNWIHYDRTDEDRAKRAKEEPFRVDFMIITTNRKIVIEIDGSSHFSDAFVKDSPSGVDFLANIDVFTTHLKKDRWLRKQGWEVYRFSNKEVEEEEIDYFMSEINFPAITDVVFD